MDKLNRIGIGYFRPLILASFINSNISSTQRVELFKNIERFIFITFRLCQLKSNYSNSKFYISARELHFNNICIEDVINEIENKLSFAFDENNNFKINKFKEYIADKFRLYRREGFRNWNGLHYFLYEYELNLMKNRGQKKVDWYLFIKSERDKCTIEHILPQEMKEDYWKERFVKYNQDEILYLTGNLGNLLPLSGSINSSLQNYGFDSKKDIIYSSDGLIIRNGYKNGSYSEIDVSKNTEWTAKEIKERGIKLLKFLEERWAVNLGDDQQKIELLHLNFL